MTHFIVRWFFHFCLLHIPVLETLAVVHHCACTATEASGCREGICMAPQSALHFACEMSVRLAPNNSITEVKYYCLTGLFPPCPSVPEIKPSGFSVHYACCDDRDECNRCMVPSSLPYKAKFQILLDANCNTTLDWIPIPTASPSSSQLTLSSGKSDRYIHAAIAVGCTTVVCLVVIPVLVLVVWCKRRQKISGRFNSRTGSDEVTCTMTVSDGNIL